MIYTKGTIARKELVHSRKGFKNQFLTEEIKSNFLFSFIQKVVKSYPTNLVFSEANLLVIWRAYKYLENRIKNSEVSVIFSSCTPYGDHYIAYLLKRKFPHLKWIADFRDLHVEPLYKDVYLPGLQEKMERKVLERADIVTTVSEGLSKHLKKYGRPTYSILRGLEIREPRKQYDKFTISYTGSLFKQYRDPRLLFRAVQELIVAEKLNEKDLQFIYAGKDGDLFTKWIAEYDLGHIYEHRGLISREEAQVIQDRSHINLLLTSATQDWQGVLTGKLFEYVESGNATLCLIKGVQDKEVEALLQKFNAGVVVYDPEIEKGKIKGFLLEKYHEWKDHGSVARRVNCEEIKKNHSWQSRVAFMLDKLAEV